MYNQADNYQPSGGQDYEPHFNTAFHRLQCKTLVFLIRNISDVARCITPHSVIISFDRNEFRVMFLHSIIPHLFVFQNQKVVDQELLVHLG